MTENLYWTSIYARRKMENPMFCNNIDQHKWLSSTLKSKLLQKESESLTLPPLEKGFCFPEQVWASQNWRKKKSTSTSECQHKILVTRHADFYFFSFLKKRKIIILMSTYVKVTETRQIIFLKILKNTMKTAFWGTLVNRKTTICKTLHGILINISSKIY
jgi:hypothetical protein